MDNIGKLLSKLNPPRFKHSVWDTKINYFQINTLCNNLKLINVLSIIIVSILTYGQQNNNPVLKNIDLTLQNMYEGQTNIYKTINKMDDKLDKIQVVQKSMNTLMKTISGLVGSIEGTVSSLEVIVGLIKLDVAAIKTSNSITSNLLVDQIPIISGNLEAIKVIQNEMQVELDIVSGDTTAIEGELIALNTILTAVAADTTGILAETTTVVASNAELAAASTASLALFTAFSEDYFNPATVTTLGFFKVHLTAVDTKDNLQVQVEQWNTNDVVNVEEKNPVTSLEVTNQVRTKVEEWTAAEVVKVSEVTPIEEVVISNDINVSVINWEAKESVHIEQPVAVIGDFGGGGTSYETDIGIYRYEFPFILPFQATTCCVEIAKVILEQMYDRLKIRIPDKTCVPYTLEVATKTCMCAYVEVQRPKVAFYYCNNVQKQCLVGKNTDTDNEDQGGYTVAIATPFYEDGKNEPDSYKCPHVLLQRTVDDPFDQVGTLDGNLIYAKERIPHYKTPTYGIIRYNRTTYAEKVIYELEDRLRMFYGHVALDCMMTGKSAQNCEAVEPNNEPHICPDTLDWNNETMFYCRNYT